jgi:phosphoribosylformylglycinamidine synthase
MLYRVEVSTRPGFLDARGESLRRQAGALGLVGIAAISVSDLYFLEGDLDDAAVSRLSDTLLYDPVVEQAAIQRLAAGGMHRRGAEGAENKMEPPRPPRLRGEDTQTVEVALLPGVTDSVAESLLGGARLIGVTGLARAATGRRYEIAGRVSPDDATRLAEGLLANVVIQTYAVDEPVAPPFVPTQAVDATVEIIPLAGGDDERLVALSRERRLSLDLAEMQAIRAYYHRAGREPTDIELEMLAQTWSEHCVHKTFKAIIEYEELEPDGTPVPGSQRTIDSLLKTFIRAATERVNKPWVRSAFVDNAGIIAFDDRFDLAFKVETHNHPSALEPFGGANTGVGGVIRDVIGVSARPIANTDVLCFGPPDLPFDALPAGVLHPQRVADGVTAGIEDYGNKMGIPTVNGAILYDPGYTANPLVFCGCLGLLPRGAHRNQPQAGDLVVVIGGRTGRDGLRGATFSSMEMDHETGQIAGTAVQIGHPIHEKQAMEAVILARDAGLYTAITDCGAGGLSSAVGEMAAELGAEIHLERAPLKYAGLRPWEIWLSEAQERMVLAVPPANWPAVRVICDGLDIEAVVLGHFTGDGRLTLRYDGRVVGTLSADFLHNSIPRRRLRATWQRPPIVSAEDVIARPVVGAEAIPSIGRDCFVAHYAPRNDAAVRSLLSLLASPDIRSKEDVVRRYDHEVQGATVVKPFVGRANAGPSDAAVLDLRFAIADCGLQDDRQIANCKLQIANQGVALAAGICPARGEADPYAMAWAAVDEAIRNCVAVGADPDRIALLDNFCWGNPSLPDRLGGLVRCAQGCYDAAVAYGAPFISGKDSLNNEYTGADGKKHAIPGTLLISALGIVPDVARTVTMSLKAAGDRLYLVGADDPPLQPPFPLRGTPAALREKGELPTPPLAEESHTRGASHGPGERSRERLATYRALHAAMRAGLVHACHDCSEGGLAVAAAEMVIAGGLGLALRPGGQAQGLPLLFGESLGRLLVEVAPEHTVAFEARLAGLPCAAIGVVTAEPCLRVTGPAGEPAIEVELAALENAWRGLVLSAAEEPVLSAAEEPVLSAAEGHIR